MQKIRRTVFLEAIIIGLLIGLLRKGRISNLNNLKFNGINILLILIVADLLLRQYIVRSNSHFSVILFNVYPKINLVVYFITILVMGLNNHLKNMRVIQSGYVLNFLPMISNGGKMPVSADAMAKIGKVLEVDVLRNNLYLGHSLMTESTRFKVLCDTIAIPFPTPKVISVGDIVISIGIIMFLVHQMKGKKI